MRPDWYDLIRAARFFHTTPWELRKQPEWWIDLAFVAEDAETYAGIQGGPRGGG